MMEKFLKLPIAILLVFTALSCGGNNNPYPPSISNPITAGGTNVIVRFEYFTDRSRVSLDVLKGFPSYYYVYLRSGNVQSSYITLYCSEVPYNCYQISGATGTLSVYDSGRPNYLTLRFENTSAPYSSDVHMSLRVRNSYVDATIQETSCTSSSPAVCTWTE